MCDGLRNGCVALDGDYVDEKNQYLMKVTSLVDPGLFSQCGTPIKERDSLSVRSK